MENVEKKPKKPQIDAIIRRYKQYLLLEKSFSSHTIEAYLTDLDKLIAYLTLEAIHPFDVSLTDLHAFAAGLYDIGIHPRSQRRILSGVRSFYRFLVLEDYIDDDPAELLESPRQGLHLPEVLSVDEIDRIIASIDMGKQEGQRNRAILEVLYSCGLRVSELCNLRFADLSLDEGFLRVEGKGGKQRLVPVSPRAVDELQAYFLQRAEMTNIKPGHEDYVFLTFRRGGKLSRISVFHIIKEQAELAGITKTVSPHTFRHSFATHLLEGGANLRAIQEMLGHENIATTEIYTHIDRSALRREILEHHPRNMRFNHHDAPDCK